MRCERQVKDLSLLLSIKKRYKIKDKKGRVVPFRLNRAQKLVLKSILDKWSKGESVRLVIIKGRQQGISTLIQLIQLALVMKIPAYSCYSMAHDSDSARDLFENKVKFAFDNFPELFRLLYKVKKDNVRQLQFEGEMQSSSITVGTSARSTTQNFIHISEPGKMSMSTKVWEEMKSGTLPAGEQADAIIFESTPDGGLGPFYELVKSGAYDILFLGWYIQDEYRMTVNDSIEWREEYATLASRYGLNHNIQMDYTLTDEQFFWYYTKTKELGEQVKVQYPCSLEEGFISASEVYFDVNFLQKEKEKLLTLAYTDNGSVRIYHPPLAREKYSIGVDTSSGESSDYTVITVLDSAGVEVANWRKKADENLISTVLYNLALAYNQAVIAIEITEMGRVVLRKIREDYNYPHYLLYRDMTKAEKVKGQNLKFGWFTTGESRSRMLFELRSALYAGEVSISTINTIDEMLHFTLVDGKYQAQAGHHDDCIMSLAVAYQALLYRQKMMI